MARQEVARQQDQDQIGLVAASLLVHQPHPVGVAVVGDPQVRPDLDHSRHEVAHVLLDLGVGEVVGEGAVQLAVELDHLAPEPAQQIGRVERGDGVPRVHDHLQAPGDPDALGDDGEVVLLGAAPGHPARARLEIPRVDQTAQILNLVLRQRDGAAVDHLDAVVGDGVVAARNVGPAVQLPVGGGEVEDGGR